MASEWTVEPPSEYPRLPLSWRGKDFWIEVKPELSQGERNRIRTAGIGTYSRRLTAKDDDDRLDVRPDLDAATYEKLHVWLHDWSLTDDKQNKLPLLYATYRTLRSGLFDVIDKAIEVHAKAVEEEEKKVVPTTEASDAS